MTMENTLIEFLIPCSPWWCKNSYHDDDDGDDSDDDDDGDDGDDPHHAACDIKSGKILSEKDWLDLFGPFTGLWMEPFCW